MHIIRLLIAITLLTPTILLGSRLDEVAASLGGFIKSHRVEDRSAFITLDSKIWDSMTKDQQLRLCNQLASTDFLRKDNLLNAYLSVDGTDIGRIKPTGSGSWEFLPNGRYWKNR
jgi:hypothetical protein